MSGAQKLNKKWLFLWIIYSYRKLWFISPIFKRAFEFLNLNKKSEQVAESNEAIIVNVKFLECTKKTSLCEFWGPWNAAKYHKVKGTHLVRGQFVVDVPA